MNAYLKEIADISGINKKLTFHAARHTFATTVTLTNGVLTLKRHHINEFQSLIH